MQTMMVQTKIDFKRAYWRNPRFVIFSLVIHALLFFHS